MRIDREWKNSDVITLGLPMDITVRQWAANHNSVSVNYGPLTFSLKIGERYQREDSSRTAIGDSAWQKTADPSKWPSFEIYPTTPWNYGLVLNEAQPAKSFTVKQGAWPADDFPFTPESCPIQITAQARQIPEWTIDRYGLCGVLQDSPVATAQPTQDIALIPMGAARLRIASLPTVSNGTNAHKWHESLSIRTGKPAYRASASHCFSGDTIDALSDGIEPVNSNDEDIPRLTWWDHRGTAEWVQYDFAAPKKISSTEVYWFDDTDNGQCRVPESWHLLYKSGDIWIPIGAAADFQVKKDGWNRVQFPPVETTQLRLEVQLQSQFSGGILEWKVE